jgi:amino acid efflux transporter
MAAAASLPNIVVRLFGVQALWIACVIGYLACFASLNIYIQSFARLVWSQAQYKPKATSPAVAAANPAQCAQRRAGLLRHQHAWHLLAGYQSGCADRLCQRHFHHDYLLCMLAGCRLLKGRYRVLAFIGACSACCCWRWSAGRACTRW